MSDSIRIGHVQRHLLFVRDHWADLHEARMPGTPRPWSQTKTRAESRQRAMDEHEHYAKNVLGLGATPAPAHVDILDTLVDVLAVSHALSDAVSQAAGIDRLASPSSSFADPTPYLDQVRKHLPAADETHSWIVDSALETKSDLSIVRARNRTAAALRLILGGQVLDADCPWCDARPLKIEMHADEPLVVCRSRRACEPAEADCGTWVRDRPAWIQPEWEWLAKRIRHAEDVQASA